MKYVILSLIILLLHSSLVLCGAEEGFTYTDDGRRDPFMPLVDEQGKFVLEEDAIYSVTDLELEGILWDPDGKKSTALINDQIVKVGEKIFGFFIKDITQNSVTVSQEGQEYTLTLIVEEEGGLP